MLLYSPHITTRLRYIAGFISIELFNEAIVITADKEQFIQATTAKLNYSETAFGEDDFFIQSKPLLFETSIRPQVIECFKFNDHKAFFESGGFFPVDIFAASFYLISRYEEYLPHRKDEYGRYDHTESLAFREGFLDMPLVNIWLHDLKKA